MRPVAAAFLLSLVLAGCSDGGSSSSRAQATPATQTAPDRTELTGRVLEDGAPVEGAVLIVSSVDTGLVPETVDPESMFSDAVGAFRIEVDPGRYRVLAIGPTGSQSDVEFEVGQETVPVELNLTSDPKAVEDFLNAGPRFERSEDVQ